MRYYRQDFPRQPDRNMIEPSRADSLLAGLHLTIDGIPAVPDSYHQPAQPVRYRMGHPKPQPVRTMLTTVVAILLCGLALGFASGVFTVLVLR